MPLARILLPLLLASPGAVLADADLRTALSLPDGRAVPASAPAACTGGLRNDDGSYEGAVGYANAVPLGSYVMAFDIPEGFAPTRICICWTRGPFSTGPDIDFERSSMPPTVPGPRASRAGRAPSWAGSRRAPRACRSSRSTASPCIR